MPKIHVDEQVMAELNNRAAGRTPNDVLRQLFGLWSGELQTAEPGIYLVPHSPKEFPKGAAELSRWLSDYLARDGEYNVASPHYWRNVVPGSVCLFHKDRMIIGEGKMVGGLMPYNGKEISPQTGTRYAGVVHFDPASIKVYGKPVTFETAKKLLGKPLSFRGIQRLMLLDYARIQGASSRQ